MRKLAAETFNIDFGQNLRQLREERELTQKQVAQKLKISESTYANWEQGRREPDLYYLVVLSRFFEVDINSLFDFMV